MGDGFYRVVELVFTAYAVPALAVPLVWLARRVSAVLEPRQPRESVIRLNRALRIYGLLAAAWLGAWVAVRLGMPVEKGGKVAGMVFWLAYVSMNIVLAWLFVDFTAEYGSLPEGAPKDGLFLRLLWVVLAQPVSTACAFSVLFRIMGVVYRMKVPALGGVQEGI